MNLHDHFSRTKMFRAMDKSVDSDPQANSIKKDVISALNSNTWFRKLNAKQQSHYLKGNTAFFMSKDEIVQASGGNVSEFRFMYRFLSNNTHSLPMAFYRMDESERGRGVESRIEVEYTRECLGITTNYLNKSNQEFTKLFHGPFNEL